MTREEIIALAKQIGTYAISILPEPDCCTLFQPAHPVTRGNVEKAESNEGDLPVEDLVQQAVEHASIHDYDAHGEPVLSARRADSHARP